MADRSTRIGDGVVGIAGLVFSLALPQCRIIRIDRVIHELSISLHKRCRPLPTSCLSWLGRDCINNSSPAVFDRLGCAMEWVHGIVLQRVEPLGQILAHKIFRGTTQQGLRLTASGGRC